MKSIELLDQVLANGFTSQTAVIDKEKAITYNELRLFSFFLADVLISTGNSRANDAVLIYLDKKVEAIISIFGTLMSGSAYVPIDTSLPPERIHHITAECRPSLIITRAKMAEHLPELIKSKYKDQILAVDVGENGSFLVENITRQQVYTINTGSDGYPALARKFKNRPGSPDDLAYIIFTSGSSGKPKGVMIKHKSAAAFVEEIKRMTIYDADTRFLNISPLYFDASILDIFSVLAVGGTLILMKKWVLPNEIVLNMDKYQVTDTLMVSSLLRLFGSRYSNLHHFKLAHLKTIWYGAEACPVEVLRRIKEQLPQVKFIHGYGPTETTHTATLLMFDQIKDKYRDYMPIGKPLSTVHTYALSGGDRYIKPGEIGELYIGGIQLMAGYINDPVRTNDVLCPDLSRKSTHVYKTGDFVSLDEDDNYVFEGRHDDLVKVGGSLVSLCEVQNSILANPGVADAIVLALTDALFNNKLSAFIVKKEETLQESDLVEFLGAKLEKYKIPEIFIFIDENALPRTANGKIDKAKLIKIAERYNQVNKVTKNGGE